MMVQQQERDLSFIEQAMYDAIRQATPEQQAELRALSSAQSLAEFTCTLQSRFPQRAQYITEERVKNVLAYDKQRQARTPPAHQVQPGAKPASQPVPPAPASMTPKVAREEMWLITLAKSKIMRFFAVSCEFIIFLGCLWLTLVTIMPGATGWLNGSIDNFFLIALGFAVDAALPEAWLHVVDQYTDTPRKITQLKWSIPIAIGMLILVVANFVYAKVAGTSGQTPTGALAIVVNTLLIARMFIGISYVTIRECQSFLDRKQGKQQPHDAPHLQPGFIEHQIAEATQSMQEHFERRLEAITNDQARHITNVQTTIEQRLVAITGDQARMLASLAQVQQSAPAIDIEALTEAIRRQVEAENEAKFASLVRQSEARFEALLRQRVTVSEAHEAKRIEAPKPRREAEHEATRRGPAATNILTLRQPGNDATDKRAAVYKLLEAGDQRSSYQLAPVVGCSAATVQRYMKDWKEAHDEAEREATGTDE